MIDLNSPQRRPTAPPDSRRLFPPAEIPAYHHHQAGARTIKVASIRSIRAAENMATRAEARREPDALSIAVSCRSLRTFPAMPCARTRPETETARRRTPPSIVVRAQLAAAVSACAKRGEHWDWEPGNGLNFQETVVPRARTRARPSKQSPRVGVWFAWRQPTHYHPTWVRPRPTHLRTGPGFSAGARDRNVAHPSASFSRTAGPTRLPPPPPGQGRLPVRATRVPRASALGQPTLARLREALVPCSSAPPGHAFYIPPPSPIDATQVWSVASPR
jgi:hypothetical protein